MKLTLSAIKADVGSVGGHTRPSDEMLEAVRGAIARAVARGLILDSFVAHTGDDILILMSHTRGEGDAELHRLAWDAASMRGSPSPRCGRQSACAGLCRDACSTPIAARNTPRRGIARSWPSTASSAR